jgi:hypothetical protein
MGRMKIPPEVLKKYKCTSLLSIVVYIQTLLFVVLSKFNKGLTHCMIMKTTHHGKQICQPIKNNTFGII